ncbi:MAG: proline--tRNA ligase, partial [Chloroflexi bacterium]|nr:proline--tRNA ligase [Chloroflexota bacterium]
DEPRPRGGLIRLREFHMKDAYSFHVDQADLDAYYPHVYQAYANIFYRAGLSAQVVEADPGMMGGTGSHEFMLLTEVGEDTLVHCAACGYAANMEAACGVKQAVGVAQSPRPRPIEKVDTPNIKTIAELMEFFGIEPANFLKTVVYSVEGQLVMAIIRGDLDVNEIKLARILGTGEFALGSEAELAARHIAAGFVSPVGVSGIRVIADDSVTTVDEFVAGGNEVDVHLRHVRLGRDFEPDVVADIALVRDGDGCPRCGEPVAILRGIELGHIFKLGTKYSASMGAMYTDAQGQEHPVVMGCYGIGLDRLLAAVAEHYHDERGLVWPRSIAPYQVILVTLQPGQPEVAQAAESLYAALRERGVEVLFDDREASPGVKFADADLWGMPLRVVISPRNVQAGQAELKLRTAEKGQLVPMNDVLDAIDALLAQAP